MEARPKKKESATVSISAALFLLDAIVNAKEQQVAAFGARARIGGDFGSGREGDLLTFVTVAAQKAAAGMNFTSLSPTELLRVIHMNASAAVAKTTLPADDLDVTLLDPVNQLVDWVSEVVLPGICGERAGATNLFTPREFFQLALASVLAVFSDCVLLDISSALVVHAIERWMATLVAALQSDPSLALLELVPIVVRLCNISKPTIPVQKSCSLLWEFMLRHLAVMNGKDESCTSKACLEILNGGAGQGLVKQTTDFVRDGVQVNKKRGGATKLKWGEDNASASSGLELLKTSARVGDACMYLAETLGEDAGAADSLILQDLLHCPALKTKPAALKSLTDAISNKENGFANRERVMSLLAEAGDVC